MKICTPITNQHKQRKISHSRDLSISAITKSFQAMISVTHEAVTLFGTLLQFSSNYRIVFACNLKNIFNIVLLFSIDTKSYVAN